MRSTVFDAHEQAFAFFRGTCRRGVYDNMRTAVAAVFIGKDRQFARGFLQHCAHYLFEPTASRNPDRVTLFMLRSQIRQEPVANRMNWFAASRSFPCAGCDAKPASTFAATRARVRRRLVKNAPR
jgi:hypothetical protein